MSNTQELENTLSIDDKYRLYIIWKTRPIPANAPQDTKAFCEKFSLTPQDIQSFHDRLTYGDDVKTALISWAKSRLPEIIHGAYSKAKESKSIADAEKFVQILETLETKNKNTPSTVNFINIPKEKMQRIAKRITNI